MIVNVVNTKAQLFTKYDAESKQLPTHILFEGDLYQFVSISWSGSEIVAYAKLDNGRAARKFVLYADREPKEGTEMSFQI